MQQAYYDEMAKAEMWQGPRAKASDRSNPIDVDATPFTSQAHIICTQRTA
jgi:hypothetical protein